MSKEITLTEIAYTELISYLNGHEVDIVNNINDFGELWHLFEDVIGREPVDV